MAVCCHKIRGVIAMSFQPNKGLGTLFFLVGKRRASWDFRTFNFVKLSRNPIPFLTKGRVSMGSDDGIKFFFSRLVVVFLFFPISGFNNFSVADLEHVNMLFPFFFSKAKKRKDVESMEDSFSNRACPPWGTHHNHDRRHHRALQ